VTRCCAMLLAAFLVCADPTASAQQSAPGPECGRATTPADRAACADPGLAVANTSMSFAFQGLKAQLPADQQAALLQDQQAWTEARAASCGDNAGAALVRCLLAETQARERMLAGGGRNRDRNAPRLQPVFFREVRKDRYDIDVAYPEIPHARSPGETAFNKTAHDAILGDVGLMSQYRNAEGAGLSAHVVFYDVHYLGPRLATIVFWLVSRSRAWAHPFTARETLVFDLALGRPLHPDDVIEAPAQAVAPIAALCKRRLEKDAAEQSWRLLPNANPATAVANFQNWAPGPFALDILFDAGIVAADTAGTHECRLDYPLLALNIKLKAPLPPR
jgi:uncharacterized protein YecT (DUF1311 family)